ncbi:hypothetical protein Trydic_g17810 [Trypoxylus dichotomus]
MNLSEKVVLVTGGLSGIGASCVVEFPKNGIKGVVVADISSGEEIIQNFNAKYGEGGVTFVKADVFLINRGWSIMTCTSNIYWKRVLMYVYSASNDCLTPNNDASSNKGDNENAFQKTVDTYNSIDILISAAGIADENDWQRLIQVNLIGPSIGCNLAINTYFPKYKTGASAYIINISSIAGIIPYKDAPHYAATKHGLIGLTRSYGQNKVIIEQDVFVMALCPGRTDTPMENPTFLSKTLYGDQLLEDLFAVPSQK